MIIVDHCHNVYLSVALSACLAINPFTTAIAYMDFSSPLASEGGSCWSPCGQVGISIQYFNPSIGFVIVLGLITLITSLLYQLGGSKRGSATLFTHWYKIINSFLIIWTAPNCINRGILTQQSLKILHAAKLFPFAH